MLVFLMRNQSKKYEAHSLLISSEGITKWSDRMSGGPYYVPIEYQPGFLVQFPRYEHGFESMIHLLQRPLCLMSSRKVWVQLRIGKKEPSLIGNVGLVHSTKTLPCQYRKLYNNTKTMLIRLVKTTIGHCGQGIQASERLA